MPAREKYVRWLGGQTIGQLEKLRGTVKCAPSGQVRYRMASADMTAAIESRVERHAPGFRDCILARHTINAAEYETYNPNYVGGDINGGVQDWRQLFTRPVTRLDPYATPNPRLFLCSSSTPPGGGVHGMCGYHAARSALRRALR